MALTPAGTPYVESSDLVANYPAVSLALAEHIDDFGGKILQVIRATDVTNRSTTSTTFVDVTGMAVSITPLRSTSNLIILANYFFANGSGASDIRSRFQITDASNVAISGAQSTEIGLNGVGTGVSQSGATTLVAYINAASTAARTYKLRFNTTNAASTANVIGANSTSQMYAIEVSA